VLLNAVTERPAIFQEHYLLPSTREGAIWPFSRDYLKPRHFHAQLEFLLVRRGSVRVRSGYSSYRVHAGQLVWHLPGIEHAVDEVSQDCDLRVVHVEPDLCARLVSRSATVATECGKLPESTLGWARDLGELTCGRPVVELKSKDRDRLFELCDTTCANEGLTAGEASVRVRAALSTAWAATLADHDDRRPLSLIELASCLLFDDPSLERSALCRSLDVSEGYLSRRFQAELGVSFSTQRARTRVAAFVTRVTRERRNYLEAALASGFNSYSQLHRVFWQVVGLNPKAYFHGDERNLRANRTSL
jgi:AraC-like DNA-binding protein